MAVFVIHGGRKVWIPTPSALAAMGYDWLQVAVVPDGTLSGFPRFDIPSASSTPGSIVFPPNTSANPGHHPLTGVPGTTQILSQGREVQLVELYGWLREAQGQCNTDEGAGADIHYELELDTAWAVAHGIDLNRVLRVGNINKHGIRVAGSSERSSASLPTIHVELNSWGWRSHFPTALPPEDWTHQEPSCAKVGLIWPFNPYPAGGYDRDINVPGPYVRVAGSLITDFPHDMDGRADWSPNVDLNNPEHFARWTEVHPPDLIEVIPKGDPRYKEHTIDTRGVTLAAGTGFPLIPSCEELEFELAPQGPRPAATVVAYDEQIGPETHWPWGRNGDNGSWVDVFEDRIRVRTKVCGGYWFGSPGRFKALYRVWWTQGSPKPPRSDCSRGCDAQRDFCMASVAERAGPRPGQCTLEHTRCLNACARGAQP